MSKAAAKKRKAGPGRPPVESVAMHQIALRLPVPMLDAVDSMIANRLDQPERSAIIRELIAEALAARAKAKK